MVGNHKGHKGHKGGTGMWGAAPHPGREKFSLHPRHVYDVPKWRPGNQAYKPPNLQTSKNKADIPFIFVLEAHEGARTWDDSRVNGDAQGVRRRGTKLPSLQTSKLPRTRKE